MKDSIKKLSLKDQLVGITLISIIFSIISLVVILPNLLTPFYEKNIYQLLEQPLQYIKPGQTGTKGNTAYIIYTKSSTLISDNFYKLVDVTSPSEITNKINNDYGKLQINNQTYYYSTKDITDGEVITITDDTYIKEQKDSIYKGIGPAMLITMTIIIFILIFYSNYIVRKISKIKMKVDNLDNPNYIHNEKFYIDDELNSLMTSIEKTRISLLNKEEYKNNMFQNISHDLKTPITVITSHVEAINDEVINPKEGLEVIKNEALILNKKVSLIMELNKLNYLKENIKTEPTDIEPIILNLFNKLKIVRPELEFKFTKRGSTKFNGNIDYWEIILNNILDNFIRYAKKKVKISIKQNTIELSNDGEKISDDLIDQIFEPYKMGQNGKHGLGLAIVKQTLNLFGYNITVTNKSNGVLFIIK